MDLPCFAIRKYQMGAFKEYVKEFLLIVSYQLNTSPLGVAKIVADRRMLDIFFLNKWCIRTFQYLKRKSNYENVFDDDNDKKVTLKELQWKTVTPEPNLIKLIVEKCINCLVVIILWRYPCKWQEINKSCIGLSKRGK